MAGSFASFWNSDAVSLQSPGRAWMLQVLSWVNPVGFAVVVALGAHWISTLLLFWISLSDSKHQSSLGSSALFWLLDPWDEAGIKRSCILRALKEHFVFCMGQSSFTWNTRTHRDLIEDVFGPIYDEESMFFLLNLEIFSLLPWIINN